MNRSRQQMFNDLILPLINFKMKKAEFLQVHDEIIMSKIYLIRGQKVMLDRDLAELYGVETKQLKRQVTRNMERFPEDFMFELTQEEFNNLRCQFATSKNCRTTPIF